jgi:glycosyltransferase involved in cell wall biosynthesis
MSDLTSGIQPSPRVGVGMPVYNGANFVAEAIESVLNQTFEDFELVISDNASTDETGEICLSYAAQDPRIRYLRNRKNLGGGPNFTRVFQLSRGEFYKIANHDDVCHPRFLELCVEALDSDPEIVSAYPLTVDIDETGAAIRKLSPAPEYESPDPATRVWEALQFEREPLALFGVMRSEIVVKTGLMASVPSADRIWLAELLMHGRFQEVHEPLYLHREHPLRSTYSAGRGHASMAWWDPSKMGTFRFPYWRMMRKLAEAIHRSPMSAADKRHAYLLMLRWTTTNQHHLKLFYDVAIPLRPLIDRLYPG